MARNANQSRNEKAREPILHRSRRDRKGPDQDKKSFWTPIGAAWDHGDGERMTLQLRLVPVNGGRRSRKD